MEQNRALFRALRLERVVTFITIGLIVFVAALNILISLIMMVMEKTRDIAVLVSMGARREQVRRIFIWQGLLIGIIGTALGLVVGYTVAILAGHYHWISLSAEVYAIDYVPFVPRAIDARAGGGGFAGDQLYRHGVSIAIGGAGAAGRGAALRVEWLAGRMQPEGPFGARRGRGLRALGRFPAGLGAEAVWQRDLIEGAGGL